MIAQIRQMNANVNRRLLVHRRVDVVPFLTIAMMPFDEYQIKPV